MAGAGLLQRLRHRGSEVVLLEFVDVVRRLERMAHGGVRRTEAAARSVGDNVLGELSAFRRDHVGLAGRNKRMGVVVGHQETGAGAVGDHDQGALVARLHGRRQRQLRLAPGLHHRLGHRPSEERRVDEGALLQ